MNDANLITVAYVALAFSCWRVRDLQGTEHGANLSISETTCWRGIFIVLIVLTHLAILPGMESFFFFDNIGNLSVSIFFFLSGYGLLYQYKKRKDIYFRHFWRNKLQKLLIPYAVVRFFYMRIVPAAWYGVDRLSEKVVIGSFLKTGVPIVTNGWFFWAIFLAYGIFYVSFRWSTQFRYAYAMLLGLFLVDTVGFFALSRMQGWLSVWWYSNLAVPLGVFVAQNKDRMETWLLNRFGKRYPQFLAVFAGVTVLIVYGYLLTQKIIIRNDNMWIDISRFLGGPIFCLFFWCLSLRYQIKSKVFSFLGNISYELYLIHGAIYILSGPIFQTYGALAFICFVLFVSIGLASLYHYGTYFFARLIKKKMHRGQLSQ